MLHTRIPPHILCASALMLCALSPAHAQSSDLEASSWRFQLTPYVWTPSLRGSITVSPSLPTAHVSEPFSDIWKDLHASAFLNATARKDRYVLHLDMSHVSLHKSASLPAGFPLEAKARIKQTSVSVLGGYNWELSANDSLDAMVGARWWNVRSSVEAQPLLPETRLSKRFTDPILAVRWRHQFNPQWSTLLYADAGGFGVGSHATWQVLATVNYQVREQLYLSLGYRQLNVDYRKDAQRMDLRLDGPILGLTMQF